MSKLWESGLPSRLSSQSLAYIFYTPDSGNLGKWRTEMLARKPIQNFLGKLKVKPLANYPWKGVFCEIPYGPVVQQLHKEFHKDVLSALELIIRA